LVTVAVNGALAPGWTVAVAGVTATVKVVTGPGTVIADEADFVESATDVAVMVTLRAAAGGVAGGL
jgi:hypothetical protein